MEWPPYYFPFSEVKEAKIHPIALNWKDNCRTVPFTEKERAIALTLQASLVKYISRLELPPAELVELTRHPNDTDQKLCENIYSIVHRLREKDR